MSLARQLILATTVTIAGSAAVVGAGLVLLERRQLTAEAESETAILATSVGVAVENALRDGQVPDVVELVGRLEQIAGQMDVIVTDPEDRVVVTSGGDTMSALERRVHAAARTGPATEVQHTAGVPVRIVSALPLLRDDGSRQGTLIVSRPLNALVDDLSATSLALLGAIATYVALTTAMMSRILRRQVTAPLEVLARATRSMGERLEAPLDLPTPRPDEIGDLTRVIRSLQTQLIDARDAMIREAAQREQLERHLLAADKLIAVGQLAAGVAHEIGSPLQILVGRARLIAESSGDADVVRQARIIVDQGDRITRILGRMQDLARKRPPRQEPVCVSVEVEKVVGLVQTDARHRDVRLTWRPCDGADDLTADPDEVQQVALNLILNALQATQPGGEVDVRVTATAAEVQLTVTDTGCGIEADRLAHIFDPFHTSRADVGGTGLGLSVVRGILRRTDSRVEVTSAVGRGSAFIVTWPRPRTP